MEKLSSDDVFKLAKASPKFAQLIKAAANGAVFNEDVPGAQGGQAGPNDSGTGYPSNSAPAGVVPPAGGEKPPEEFAAVPQEGEVPVEAPVEDTPEAAGARAAQAFLGPIMESAMAGDVNAQDIVAKSAGNVAGAVAAQYSKSMAGSPAIAGGVPVAPPAIATPEEDLANQIVSEQAPVPAAAPAEGDVPEGEDGGKKSKDEKKKFPFKK